MTNKLFAVFNIVVGSIQLFIELSTLVFVRPRLMNIYSEFGAEIPIAVSYHPYFLGLLAILTLAIVLLGVKLIRSKEPNDALYKLNFLSALFLIIVMLVVIPVNLVGLISPLYNITSDL